MVMEEAGEKQMYEVLSGRIIGAAIRVHRVLGPGLMESAYEACTAFELLQEGLLVETQKPLPLIYKTVHLDVGYRIDMFVENKIVVEFKAIETILPIHEAQLMSYLKLSGCKVGLLNFNVKVMKDGVRRFVNGTFTS
jgi:GxxExxY protein